MNWDELYNQGRDYAWLSTNSLDWFLRQVDYRTNQPPKSKRISALDIGCGTGQVVRDLYHRGFKVKGIDTSRKAISIARKSTQKKYLISFECKDIENEPLLERFDLIFCKYVLAFVENKNDFLKNISIMLRSGDSHFVLVSPDPKMIPETKKSIAVKDSYVREILTLYFNTVTVREHKGDFWYFCKKGVVAKVHQNKLREKRKPATK